MVKRKALSQLSDNERSITNFFSPSAFSSSSKPSTTAAATTNPTSTPLPPPPISTRKNPGGSSKLGWFNLLASRPEMAECKANLVKKILKTTTNDSGCEEVVGFKEDTRPVMDGKHLAVFRAVCEDAPTRYMPYHIAMLAGDNLCPTQDPPPYPSELRKVKTKRAKLGAGEDMEKDATWVVSHLCHNKRCVNIAHLRWEPSWFNRLRDNCPGGEECPHRPDRCLRPHRAFVGEIIDWTKYLKQ